MSLDKPHVVVVGAGAMGGLFGGLLAEGGLPVTLVDASAEHIEAIRKAGGIRITGVGGDRVIAVSGTTRGADVTSADVVLFQCKAFANEAAAQSVKHLFAKGAVAISFQNGLGNEETLERILGPGKVIGGLTAQAGLVEAPGVVRNGGDLPTHISEMGGGPSDRVQAIAQAFTAHGLNTLATADIRREKWKKLLGNVALGAISAITDYSSAELMRVPELRETVFRLVDEAALVARAEKVTLDVAEARSVLMKLVDTEGGGTGNSKSSMCEDILRRRPTEIDTIHGSVARLARAHDIPTPTLDALIALVKGLQSKYLTQGAAA